MYFCISTANYLDFIYIVTILPPTGRDIGQSTLGG